MLARLGSRGGSAARMKRTPARRGATVVESAIVLSIFLMFLFGIFEYCRFLYVLHVTNNAAREGARYASVNVGCSTGFQMLPAVPCTQVSSTQTAVTNYTTQMMSGAQNNIAGYQVAVYTVDATGLAQSPPVIRAASANPPTYPNPFNPNDPNAVPWNSAPFPNRVAVTVQGTYVPALPILLFMPDSIPITITAIVGAE